MPNADGAWVYEGTSIRVPGARTITLRERVRPRVLRRPEGEPEAAVFSLSEIIDEPQLNWVLQAGTRLRGGEEDVFSVPWQAWVERSQESVSVWAPEQDATGLVRQLAIDERAVRFARDALERALATRVMRLAVASHLGMSRRRLGDVLGLSAPRVQQLLDDAPPEIMATARELAANANRVIKGLPDGEVTREQVPVPAGWDREHLDRVLDRLIEHGLLQVGPSGGLISVDASVQLRTARLRAVKNPEMTASDG